MSSSESIATSDAAKIPNQRPKPPPENSDMAARISSTPRISVIQPQVLRPLNTYVAPLTVTKCDSEIAAIPQMMLRTPLMLSMMAAKIHQPVTLSKLSTTPPDD